MVMAKKKRQRRMWLLLLGWFGQVSPPSLSTQTTFQGKRGRDKRGRKTGGGGRMEEAVFFFRRGIRP